MHTLVKRPSVIRCLLPLALSASAVFLSSQVLMNFLSFASCPSRTSVILKEITPPQVTTHLSKFWRCEGYRSLREPCWVIDCHLWLVDVQIGPLRKRVVVHQDHRIFQNAKLNRLVKSFAHPYYDVLLGPVLGGRTTYLRQNLVVSLLKSVVPYFEILCREISNTELCIGELYVLSRLNSPEFIWDL